MKLIDIFLLLWGLTGIISTIRLLYNADEFEEGIKLNHVFILLISPIFGVIPIVTEILDKYGEEVIIKRRK